MEWILLLGWEISFKLLPLDDYVFILLAVSTFLLILDMGTYWEGMTDGTFTLLLYYRLQLLESSFVLSLKLLTTCKPWNQSILACQVKWVSTSCRYRHSILQLIHFRLCGLLSVLFNPYLEEYVDVLLLFAMTIMQIFCMKSRLFPSCWCWPYFYQAWVRCLIPLNTSAERTWHMFQIHSI